MKRYTINENRPLEMYPLFVNPQWVGVAIIGRGCARTTQTKRK